MTPAEALRLAMKEGLDLVEVNPKADPPILQDLGFIEVQGPETADVTGCVLAGLAPGAIMKYPCRWLRQFAVTICDSAESAQREARGCID